MFLIVSLKISLHPQDSDSAAPTFSALIAGPPGPPRGQPRGAQRQAEWSSLIGQITSHAGLSLVEFIMLLFSQKETAKGSQDITKVKGALGAFSSLT